VLFRRSNLREYLTSRTKLHSCHSERSEESLRQFQRHSPALHQTQCGASVALFRVTRSLFCILGTPQSHEIRDCSLALRASASVILRSDIMTSKVSTLFPPALLCRWEGRVHPDRIWDDATDILRDLSFAHPT
jgi:hypothetical protein